MLVPMRSHLAGVSGLHQGLHFLIRVILKPANPIAFGGKEDAVAHVESLGRERNCRQLSSLFSPNFM